MRNLKYDLMGQRFGHLLVVGKGKDKNGRLLWECKCDCGNTKFVRSDHLRTRRVNSCGCKKYENSGHAKHNESHNKKTRLYAVWQSMKERCYNPNSNSRKYYYDKGVKVCDEWRNNYTAFKEWAMNNGYDPNAPKWEKTLDRIDGNKDYSPDNCRWVNMKVQIANRTMPKNEEGKEI